MIMQELMATFSSPTTTVGHTERLNPRPMLSLIKEAEMQALRVTNILQRVDATLALVRTVATLMESGRLIDT